jgi:DNA-binding NarL/FixJ family response regulator
VRRQADPDGQTTDAPTTRDQTVQPFSTASDVTTGPIRIALVDDQQLVRAGFRMVIDSQPDLTVVLEAGDGAQAVRALTRVPADPGVGRVDVVLMDVRMPTMDGLTATAAITTSGTEHRPAPRVIVLTTFDVDEYVLAAIRAGASGFLLKDARPEEMLGAIRTVHRGDAVIAPSSMRRLLEHLMTVLPAAQSAESASSAQRAVADLTDREREVLVLMAHGRSNTEIGRDLFVAEATVKTHVGRILAKLGVRDRVQAVVVAYETGLVRAGS